MKSADVAGAAYGRWPDILAALGVDAKFLVDRHGPCPICGGKDRFRFDDREAGFWFCSACTSKGGGRPDGFSLLQHLNGWTFGEVVRRVAEVLWTVQDAPPRPHRPEKTDVQKADDCRRLLAGSQPLLEGGPALAYLRHRCGDVRLGWLGDLREHPGIEHPDGGTHPALLEVWRRPDGSGGSVQRVYLTLDGSKAQVSRVRMLMPGRMDGGGAVRLGPSGRELGIAEGVETALCAAMITGHPVWAALNANLLKIWEPPANVEMVRIFADNDASFTGQEAAYHLAKRLKQKGLGVEVIIPSVVGSDFADIYMTF